MIGRILAFLVVALLIAPLSPAGHPAEAKKKFRTKTVTRTFTNTGAIAIPGTGTEGEANPFPSTIQVGGIKKGSDLDVNLTLNALSHADPGDLGVLLVAANGRPALVMDGTGGNDAVVDIALTFDDEAAAVISVDDPLTAGTFRPSVFPFPSGTTAGYPGLAALDGSNPNGAWELFVFDDNVNETGAIAEGWTLTIRAKEKIRKKK